jgi:hypothetical protein
MFTKFTNSEKNFTRYINKYGLELIEAESAWIKLGKFANVFNKFPMVRDANEDTAAPMEADMRCFQNI